MPETIRFPFAKSITGAGETKLRPVMPLTLERQGRRITAAARIDSGADVSVLPYSVGLALGANWDEEQPGAFLTGNLARLETRTLGLGLSIGSNRPVGVVFAWVLSDDIPMLLGQYNFFDAFNVCFFRGDGYLEVTPRR